MTLALAAPGTAPAAALKAALRRGESRQRWRALGLVAPLALFLLLTFVGPLALFLQRAVDNAEIPGGLPLTLAALADWDRATLPGEPVFAALRDDLTALGTGRESAILARRLNYEIPGFRSLLLKTVEALPAFPTGPAQAAFTSFDPRWGELPYWQVIARNDAWLTAFYLLAALDHGFDAGGSIVAVPAGEAIYLPILLRTLWISASVTLLCLLIGYPVARLLATLPARTSNLLMVFVLLPFWTSLLVRSAAWIIILGQQGPVNAALQWLGLVEEPLQLVFNRFGLYVAMTHVLLPFMILPLYSVMKGISPSYMRAATSLGATPFKAFLGIYLPQTLPGIAAGALLVFILAIGYYITPALVGGTDDQMISYFVAFYTNGTANWGLASALGTVLLVVALLLFALYSRLVRLDSARPAR